MKSNYSAFAEDIPPYSGPKAARETYADLKQLSAIPGHIYMHPELQILPGQRRFSKMPWLVPMLELLPPTSIGTILLEELEIMLGLPCYQRGEESTISYTVE
ncbi:hypothetical protein Taro_042106, partial [Colocasia esculenta]|nr:hypothetical protein [Colocasia esculenta]